MFADPFCQELGDLIGQVVKQLKGIDLALCSFNTYINAIR